MSYQTLFSATDYKNPYMQVIKDQVKLPNGHIKSFYVLDRYSPFSIIIPLIDHHATILVGQYRYPAKYYSWEFPMGQVKGKSPLQMAKIELKQEIGADAHIGRKNNGYFPGSFPNSLFKLLVHPGCSDHNTCFNRQSGFEREACAFGRRKINEHLRALKRGA